MFEWFAKWILFFILRLLSWSYRFKVVGFENVEKAQTVHPLKSYVLAFWHEHLLAPLFFFEGTKFAVLTSDSRDGKIIGFQCTQLGNKVVHGSQIRNGKDKGGVRALIGLLGELRSGVPVAVTVDGSIGPRRYVKAGVLELARKSGAPIVPFASVASRCWTLNTWDQFKIPKPFSTVYVCFGEPILVGAEVKDLEGFQERVAEAINLQESVV